MAKLTIDPRIPKTWYPIIQYIEDNKEDKIKFVEYIEAQLNKGLKNPLQFIQYIAINYETIKKDIDANTRKIDIAIARLDNIGENKADHADIEGIQENLMKQESLLKNTLEDLNLIYENMTIYLEGGEVFTDQRKADILAMISATLKDMNGMKKLFIQEKNGLVQSKMVSIALRHKKAA